MLRVPHCIMNNQAFFELASGLVYAFRRIKKFVD